MYRTTVKSAQASRSTMRNALTLVGAAAIFLVSVNGSYTASTPANLAIETPKVQTTGDCVYCLAQLPSF